MKNNQNFRYCIAIISLKDNFYDFEKVSSIKLLRESFGSILCQELHEVCENIKKLIQTGSVKEICFFDYDWDNNVNEVIIDE